MLSRRLTREDLPFTGILTDKVVAQVLAALGKDRLDRIYSPLVTLERAALDFAVGAGKTGGNSLTGTVPCDLNSVDADSAPVRLINPFGGEAGVLSVGNCYGG